MIDVEAVRTRYRRIAGFLDERGRRLFAANEALALGRGGVTAVSAASGIARSTINRGIAELKAGGNEAGRACPAAWRGRKSAVELQPDLLSALEELIEGAIRGDPQVTAALGQPQQRNIATALRQQGFTVSQKLVGRLLRALDYSCQANRKTREGTQHPDRNAQFTNINARVKAALAAGNRRSRSTRRKRNWWATSRTAVESCAARASPSRSVSTTSKSRDWVRSRQSLRHCRQPGLGQCRNRCRYRSIRHREHPSLVAAARQGPAIPRRLDLLITR